MQVGEQVLSIKLGGLTFMARTSQKAENQGVVASFKVLYNSRDIPLRRHAPRDNGQMGLKLHTLSLSRAGVMGFIKI